MSPAWAGIPYGPGNAALPPRPRRSGATRVVSGARSASASATSAHDRWLAVMPWAATTTSGPSPHRPTVRSPPGTGTVNTS